MGKINSEEGWKQNYRCPVCGYEIEAGKNESIQCIKGCAPMVPLSDLSLRDHVRLDLGKSAIR